MVRRSVPAAVRARPRDRRIKIVAAASELFHSAGYHQVGMADIAEAVGITGGALYRHFSGKQHLLFCTIEQGLEVFEQLLSTEAGLDLDGLVRRMSQAALAQRHLGVLWQREARHLDRADRAALDLRVAHLADLLAGVVGRNRTTLAETDATLLAWAALSVLSSPSYHHLALPVPVMEQLLHGSAMAALGVDPTAQVAVGRACSRAEPAPNFQPPTSRREDLLAAAVERFAKRGYPAVTMADIGQAAGISGPSIYNHFASKNEILHAALWRGHDWLQLELARIMTSSTDADDAIDRLLASYTDFAFDQRHLVQMLITEVQHLPDDQRRAVRRGQHDYIGGWVTLVRGARPELDTAAARFLVHAALTVANDFARMRRFRRREGMRADVCAVGRAILRVSS